MKIYLMTDVEGSAGVLNITDWCEPAGNYYAQAKEYLTLEANAAIEGFFAGGATEIVVADGHGCGAINPALLDRRVKLIADCSMGPPFGLDRSFDAIAWVGQHARSRTVQSHLAHTNSFDVWELTINDVPVGEFGELALCAAELNVPAVFLAGEQAACHEAKALIPQIETVDVKQGLQQDPGDERTGEQYRDHNIAVSSVSPEAARPLIRAGAARAIERTRTGCIPVVKWPAPYTRLQIMRRSENYPYGRQSIARHETSIIELLRLPHLFTKSAAQL